MGRWQPSQTAWCWQSDPANGRQRREAPVPVPCPRPRRPRPRFQPSPAPRPGPAARRYQLDGRRRARAPPTSVRKSRGRPGPGPAAAQPRGHRAERGAGARRGREASGNSPSSTPNVAGPERRGWSSILIPSSIFEQSDWPRVKHLSKDSGPVAMSMGRAAARPGAPGRRGRGAAGRRGRLSPASGRARGHSAAGRRESLLFLSGRHEERFLPGLPETGGRGRSRRRRPWGLHGRAHAAHTARGSPRCHLLAGSAGAPRPPRRALPGPGRAERRGGAGRGGGASPALGSPCAMRRPEEPRRLEQGPRRRNTPPGASPLLKLADI